MPCIDPGPCLTGLTHNYCSRYHFASHLISVWPTEAARLGHVMPRLNDLCLAQYFGIYRGQVQLLPVSCDGGQAQRSQILEA